MFKNIALRLTAEQYEANFADINPPLTAGQARDESARCLFCYDAPCTAACPTAIDVPGFIHKISTGNLQGAARTILEANILGASCGRVCPTEVLCEGACVLHHMGKRPVMIGRLQRYAAEYALDCGARLFHPGTPHRGRVALIGAGPASLSCAAELRKRGYETVIYDKNPQAGGLNTYGIAAYKLRVPDALREVEMVRALGVEIRNGVEIGRDLSLEQLEKDFDAIFVGIGLGSTEDLRIPGEDLPGVVDALSFIERTKTEAFPSIELGRAVAVIGGGNTAIDAATAARRLGADPVFIVYRRSRREMPAFAYEYELAEGDGVSFLWQTQPVRVAGKGRVEALACVRTQLGAPDASGRRRPEIVPGSEFLLEVDMVIKALGQTRLVEFLRKIRGLQLDDDGCVVVDPGTMQTTNSQYFAGGDCVNGGQEVVDAVAHGKRATGGIDRRLQQAREARPHA